MQRSLIATVCVASLFLPAARAMGQPSFAQVSQPGWTRCLGLSASGRYVAGDFASNGRVFRLDRLSGALHLAPFTGATTDFGLAKVEENGWVVTGAPQPDVQPGLFIPTRWNPDTGEIQRINYTGLTPQRFYLRHLSRDGLVGVGWGWPAIGEPTRPIFADFSAGVLAARVPGAPGTPATARWRSGGVTNIINGTRFMYASTNLGDTAQDLGIVFNLGATGFARLESVDVLDDASPDGQILLGRLLQGSQPHRAIVRGSGPDWLLAAPASQPTRPWALPEALSDDGSVAVGSVSGVSSGSAPEAVVWRRDLPPATIREALAGIALPSWVSSRLYDCSADGSVVVGAYRPDSVSLDEVGFVAVLPSPNDLCAAARTVTYGSTLSSTHGGTRTNVLGTCSAEGPAPDVWFRFVPAASEQLTIDTCGSDFDTTLMLYATTNCTSPGFPLACNDDANPACAQNATNSRVVADVFAGQTYLIRVSGWNGSKGNIRLNVTAPSRPTNDTCELATQVSVGSGAFFSNANAVTDARPNCPSAGTPFSDVWFRTTATEAGRMTYSTCGSTINTVMAVYEGSACADLSAPAIACGQSNAACGGSPGTRITVPCIAGQSQLVRVGGLFGATGNGQFTARFACDENVLNNYGVLISQAAPRAYWRFDDTGVLTAADAIRADPFSCGNYPGVYEGAVGRDASPQGRALTLAGDGALVRADSIFATRISDPENCPSATIEAWVKTSDPFAGVVVTSRNNPGEHSLTMVVGYNPIGLGGTAGRVMFVSDAPGVFFGAISNARIDDGQWHHVVGRRILSGLSRYSYTLTIDGVAQPINNLAGAGSGVHTGTPGANWLVGNGTAWATADAAFNGSIDEVAIYCYSLAPATISQHAAAFNPPPPCSADFNTDGELNADDLADYINCYFANPSCPGAEFNADGSVNADDLGDYINAYFAGCS